MSDRAFIIMQIGAKDSLERKRADEIYNFIIVPAVTGAGLEAYRADLDFSPGAITPKFLSELLSARLVIADLTGRNPNVFYELGIAHSFARPMISIADSSSSLPFDTKDERIIELGEYSSTGLTYAQGEQAKVYLQESLKIVLADGYVPPSPLRELAANASVDRLAPENPIAAELAQVRENLEELRSFLRSQGDRVSRDMLEELRSFLRSQDDRVSRDMLGELLNQSRRTQSELIRIAELSEGRSGSGSAIPEITRRFAMDQIVDSLKTSGINVVASTAIGEPGDLYLELREARADSDALRQLFDDLAKQAKIMIRVKGRPFVETEIFDYR